MSTINGIPLIRDDEYNNQLFGNLFPDGLGNSQSAYQNLMQQGPPSPNALTEYKWQYLKRSLDDIQDLFFNIATPQQTGNITLVQQKGAAISFDPEDFVVYYDTNGKKGYQANEDQLLYRIKIFVTKSGQNIEQAHFEFQPQANEAAFFIEDNTGDVSSAKLYAKFGSGVKKQILLDLKTDDKIKVFLKNIPGIDDAIIKELIEKGFVQEKATFVKTAVKGICSIIALLTVPGKILGWLSEQLGELIITYLTLPETLWDSYNDNYFLKRENVVKALTISPGLTQRLSDILQSPQAKEYSLLIPDFLEKTGNKTITAINSFIATYNAFIEKAVNKIYDSYDANSTSGLIIKEIRELFALQCGLWNGFIDFVGGTLLFFGSLLQFNYDLHSNLDAYLERYDSFMDQFTLEFFTNLWEAAKTSYQEFVSYIKLQDGTDFNWNKIAYIEGYAIAFIGTFFIPFAEFAKPAELAAKLKKALVPAELLSDVSKAMAKAGAKTATGALKLIDQILALLTKSKEALAEFFKPVWEAIAKWLLKNKKVITFVDEVDAVIGGYIKVLRSNPAYIKCIERVTQARYFGRWITVEQEAMIKLYSGGTYIRLNKALRNSGKAIDEDIRAMQKVLDDALDKLPASEYNKNILKRSAQFTEREIKNLFKKGSEFTEKGYFSSTYSDEALYFWMETNPSQNVLFRIYGKNGKLIEQASLLPHESEVLFKSGTKFVVEEIKPITHPVYRDKEIFEIILKEK